MSKGMLNTCALVINYLNKTWTPRHATMGLFEMHEIISNATTLQLQAL
jgi:hypothetical protein